MKGSDLEKTHWACACIKRDRKGNLKAIKLHPLATKRCEVCGAVQFAANRKEGR